MAYEQLNRQANVQMGQRVMDVLANNVRQVFFANEDENLQYKKPAFTVMNMPSTFIDMNKSFEYVGDNSTFQKRITTILVVQWISFSFMVSAMAFFFRSPSFQCKLPLTDIYISCPQTTACKFIDTDNVRVSFKAGSLFNYNQVSIVQDFGLYCDNYQYAPLAEFFFFLGGFSSGYLFGYLAGLIGRRSVLLIILLMTSAALIVSALAQSFQIFLIGYFFCGFGYFGYETSVYIYIGEISAIRFRSISINMLTMVFVGVPLFLPLLSFIPTWRITFILFALLLCLTIPFSYRQFLQSPRFLLSKKCFTQARQVFKKISITNKRPTYDFRLIEEMANQNESFVRYIGQQKSKLQLSRLSCLPIERTYNFLTLFKYPSLKKPTLILMYLWMFKFFMYYGLNLALESVVKSGFGLVVVISTGAIMEVLGTFGASMMTTFFFKKYKLDVIKLSLIIISICTTIMYFLKIEINCKLIPIFQKDRVCPQIVLLILLFMIVKFFNTVFFSALIVYYSEIYPTPVRSLGCGFTITFGRLGTIIIPFYINYMKNKYPTSNPLSFMTPLGIFAYILCWMLPYTEIQGMKDKVEEQAEEDRNRLREIEMQRRTSSQILSEPRNTLNRPPNI